MDNTGIRGNDAPVPLAADIANVIFFNSLLFKPGQRRCRRTLLVLLDSENLFLFKFI